MEFSNRELAIGFWLAFWFGGALVYGLAKVECRPLVFDLAHRAFKPSVVLVFMFSMVYIVCVVWRVQKFSLWDQEMLKSTVIWAVLSGTLLVNESIIKHHDAGIFRRSIVGTVSVSALVEFCMDVFSFSLMIELALVGIVHVLILLFTLAEAKKEYRRLKVWTVSLFIILACVWGPYTGWQFVNAWNQLDRWDLFRQFTLPIWLTMGCLPLMYVLSLYSAYDFIFNNINSGTQDSRTRWRCYAAVLSSFYVISRDVHKFGFPWLHNLVEAPTYTAARKIISDFKMKKRKEEKAIRDEKKALRRFSGSNEVSKDGRRLDRREFKATTKSLGWLHTCMVGGYSKKNRDQYRTDMLKAVINDFTQQGLPEEHGITLKVSKGGRAWYAWRRTVTRWCFAIGANGPPPSLWWYDGPNPPESLPNHRSGWVDAFSGDASLNWLHDDMNWERY